MRKIRFRAWAHASKVMFYPNGDDGWHFVDGWIYDLPNTTLMEYIGLKDKNGTEICEGDLIFNENSFGCATSWGDATDHFPNVRLITRDSDTPCFKWSFVEESIRDRDCSGLSLCKSNEKFFEIMGNIYENPELLEAT